MTAHSATRPILKLGLGITVIVSLAACGDIDLREELGLGGSSEELSEEFRVVSRAPLSLPPDYTLRPPRPGAARPQETTTQSRARQTVFRADGSESALPGTTPNATAASSVLPNPGIGRPGVSPGEAALLRRAGIDETPRDIRNRVNAEAPNASTGQGDFAEQLIFWRQNSDEADSATRAVDPDEELRRIVSGAGSARQERAPQEDSNTSERAREESVTDEGGTRGLLDRLF